MTQFQYSWFHYTWSLFFNSTSSSSLVSGYNSKNINLQNQFINSCLKFKPSSVHAWPLISYVSMCLRMPKQNHKKKVFFLFRPTQLKDVKLCTMYHDVLAWNELASKFNLFFSKKLSQEISNIWLRGFSFPTGDCSLCLFLKFKISQVGYDRNCKKEDKIIFRRRKKPYV